MMIILYIAIIAVLSFAFSIFLVVIGEEVGIWAGALFFIGVTAITWQVVKKSLSRY